PSTQSTSTPAPTAPQHPSTASAAARLPGGRLYGFDRHAVLRGEPLTVVEFRRGVHVAAVAARHLEADGAVRRLHRLDRPFQAAPLHLLVANADRRRVAKEHV